MTDQEYIDSINAESIRRGWTNFNESLTASAGDEVWLAAWREDPTLTPEEQVQNEINHYAYDI